MRALTVIFTICLLFSLYSVTIPNKNYNQNNNIQASKYYYDNLVALQNEVNTLTEMSLIDTISVDSLQKQFLTTRTAFKKVEFFLDYFHSAYVHWYINGGPIPKFNEETTQVIPPNGFQTLDELLFIEDVLEVRPNIKTLTIELKQRLQLLTNSEKGVRIRDVQIMEALRSSCVRIFALGVTGFDTPGSGNALTDALTSLQSMEQTFLFFESDDFDKDERKHFKSILKHFKKGQKQLKSSNDFDSFDRMSFLKEVINPLYRDIYAFQKATNITTDRSIYHAQNYDATNLFDEDFLDTNHYSQFSFLPLDNPETIALGEKLFYDTNLSSDKTMSCATCHNPQKGFADGLPKSKTNKTGVFTTRNSPTLIDAAYASRYFWDLREYDLERQVNHVVENNLEFNIDFNLIAERLRHDATYRAMFDASYKGINKQTIDQRSISNAIAAYVNSLTSFNSEFDKYVRNEIKQYPKEAEAGFNLFMGKAACATCHFVPAFNGTVPPFYAETESEVLGITQGFDTINPILDNDLGRMQNNLGKEDLQMFKRSFKTVTVRNVALTAPYMHNGSFETLEDVIEFYNHGGGSGMGLEIDNQTLSPEPLGLSSREKQQLIAFMKTLTDTTGLTHPKLK
ncbi:cytochrome-c peroxidase [Hanstruepera ponticola]|uniref:cytochrome-c peroxidase n=1 Tax=Hanstruepera ponticola TaxID=2042995 RepID=UPI000CF0DF2F|nr:cytochrome-c peroxidase [Hanstruepera ponticola]